MNNKLQTEPVTLIVSMALTAMAVGLMNEYDRIWEKILVALLFIFSGEATIMLYWSIILPLIKVEFENSSQQSTVNSQQSTVNSQQSTVPTRIFITESTF